MEQSKLSLYSIHTCFARSAFGLPRSALRQLIFPKAIVEMASKNIPGISFRSFFGNGCISFDNCILLCCAAPLQHLSCTTFAPNNKCTKKTTFRLRNVCSKMIFKHCDVWFAQWHRLVLFSAKNGRSNRPWSSSFFSVKAEIQY